MNDQASRLRDMMEKKTKLQANAIANRSMPKTNAGAPRVLAITSGKGGVGKTNIVSGMALAMARTGKKVLIIDADLGLANIDIIFGIHPKYNIGHVVSGERTIKEVMAEGPMGIKIIPAGSGYTELTQLTESQKLSLLTEFENLDEDYDVVLVDTGAGISANVLYFNLAANECILIVTMEPTSLTDAFAMMKVMATQHGYKYFKLLVNMVPDAKTAKLVYAAFSKTADQYLHDIFIEYIGFVPMDSKVRDAVIQRKPFLSLYPQSEAAESIQAIAAKILARPSRNDAAGNIKFFFKRFIQAQSKIK
ncbi:MinD/ParA family protein [Desulfobacterales bacterium HSG17]|nr:MinD/ParA family protein [Desulfobacterales bacterium HSG17]